MRVTSNSFPIDLRQQLSELMEKQSTLQMRAATGQRIENASDDPRGMHKVLGLQNELRTLSQYQKNASLVREGVEVTYSAMSSLKKTYDRASELATAADGAKSPDVIRTYQHEVNQLLEQALQVSNTKHRSVFLFAGTKNTTQPYTVTRDGEGKITGVAYQGNDKETRVDVAETSTVSATFSGEGAKGVLKNDKGADFFAHLISLRDHLGAGDATSVVTKDLPNLAKDEDNFINHFSNVGALQSRLETAEAIAKKRASSLSPLISKEADVDLTDTLVRLNEIQNAYTAALQTGGTLLSTSLLDYIR